MIKNVKETNIDRIKEIVSYLMDGKRVVGKPNIENSDYLDWVTINLNDTIFSNWVYQVVKDDYVIIRQDGEYKIITMSEVKSDYRIYCKGTQKECIEWVSKHTIWAESEAEDYMSYINTNKLVKEDIVAAHIAGGARAITELINRITNPKIKLTVAYIGKQLGYLD